MLCKATSTRLVRGRSTPTMRAMFRYLLGSALTLLVLGVFANHPNRTVAPDNLALFANLFDRASDFHFSSLSSLSTIGVRPRRFSISTLPACPNGDSPPPRP